MSEAPYRDVLEQTSGWFEACARHTARSTARTLQYLYTCDPCTRRLVTEAFNGRPPVYHGETIDGYCGLCNIRQPITLRVYFVCGFCWNVIVAYQRSFVASREVHDWWARDMAAVAPGLKLVETEEVFLSPYARATKTKKQAAATLEILDFIVVDALADTDPLFHMELKSGPGNIETMKEFQLDVNDFNDVAGAVAHTGRPAYLIHVQLDFEYMPPTRRTVARGIWWTDLATLSANLKAVRGRRGEQKLAAYFNTAAFQRIDTFPSEIARRGFDELHKQALLQPVALL